MNFGYKNTAAKQKQLVSMKKKLSKKTCLIIFKVFLYCILLGCITGGFFCIGVVKGIIDGAPDISTVNIVPSSYSTTVYDADGNEMAKLVTSGSNRIKVSIDEVPEYMQWAFIDIEDERFYEHNGIDIYGIGRAISVALSSGGLSEGASTITQQVLKNNVFTGWTEESSNGAKIKRKIQEQYLALELEKVTSKEVILENYLNTINLGSNTLGVQAASQRYFNKDVSELTLSECTVIAAITQNPSALNPISHPEDNAKRREKILNNMLENGHITSEEYDEALADDVYERIQVVDAEKSESTVYSYFTDEVVSQVLNDFQEQLGYTYTQAYNAVYSGGLSIYTTMDPDIQAICDEETSDDSNYPGSTSWSIDWAWSVVHADGTSENYSESYISYYHRTLLGESSFKLIFSSKEEAEQCVEEYKKYLYPNGVAEDDVVYESLYYTPQPQISFTVMDQETGYVKAVVGGRGEKEVSLSLNRATQATRQPGSTFKILSTYAPAIDICGYTLATTEVDEPYYYANGRAVNNWYSGYKGTVTVRSAIAQSMNIIAVKVLTDITPQVGFDYLLNFGFSTLVESRTESDGSVVSDITQSLALGGITDGVTNLELCAAYASIANNGEYTKPVFYSQVVDSSGRILLDNTTPETHTVLKQSTAELLTIAMKDVVNGNGTGSAASISGIEVAGKTGTTSSNYDLWFAGYTPYLTAVIWTGYDENKDLGQSSTVTYHKYLWSTIMKRIHNEVLDVTSASFDEPEDLTRVSICKSSGKLATSACPSVIYEYFSEGTAPTSYCSYHTKKEETTNEDDETTSKKSDDSEDTTSDSKKSDDSPDDDTSNNDNDDDGDTDE